MKEKAKNLKLNFAAAAVLYLALGVVLLGWPDTTSNIICYAIGAVLLIYGLVSIISFLASREKTAALALQLVVGVVAAALGVFFLTQPRMILSIFPVLMGLFIIIVSLLSVKRAFELRRYRYPKWWAALLLALVDNLGEIAWSYPSADGETVMHTLSQDRLSEILGDLAGGDIKACAQSPGAFQKLWNRTDAWLYGES